MRPALAERIHLRLRQPECGEPELDIVSVGRALDGQPEERVVEVLDGNTEAARRTEEFHAPGKRIPGCCAQRVALARAQSAEDPADGVRQGVSRIAGSGTSR